MNKTIMAAIRAHALEESPRECCGFVIQSGRRQRYIPVPNTHENPTEHFRIDGEHWANAEDIGTIIRVIHSHPGDGARPIPSDLDRQQCNNSGVIWGIYAPDSDEYAEIMPEAVPLIGRPFIPARMTAGADYGLARHSGRHAERFPRRLPVVGKPVP